MMIRNYFIGVGHYVRDLLIDILNSLKSFLDLPEDCRNLHPFSNQEFNGQRLKHLFHWIIFLKLTWAADILVLLMVQIGFLPGVITTEVNLAQKMTFTVKNHASSKP